MNVVDDVVDRDQGAAGLFSAEHGLHPAGFCDFFSRARMPSASVLALCAERLLTMASAMSSALSCLRSNSEPSLCFASSLLSRDFAIAQ
jgi:hypothetical protein